MKCAYCGTETGSFLPICSTCETKLIRAHEAEVRGYFMCCPLCGSERIETHLITVGRDTLNCENCGAKWHLHFGLTGFQWAELDLQPRDNKGIQLLGRRLDKNEWKKMAQEARRTIPREVMAPKSPSGGEDIKGVKEREIIREKEVIVKVRCQYCHNLYNEILDKCPHCGGRTT